MKNRAIRIATFLLALTLITSCFVGSTFAKYVATAEATATGRVAYWGFESPATVSLDLFDINDSGINGDKSFVIPNYNKTADGIIAPGSKNEVTLKFITAKNINKAPEVAYRVTLTAEGPGPTPKDFGGVDGLINWTITVDGTKSTYSTWNEFKKAIAALDGNSAGGGEYGPGEPLPDILKGEEIKIGWEWPYQVYDGGIYPVTDEYDTNAGNMAFTSNGLVADLNIKMIVEQMNTYSGS